MGTSSLRAAFFSLLFLAPTTGCLSVKDWSPRDVEMRLTDEDGKPVSEWWVLSWQDSEACPVGFVFIGHGTNLIPSTSFRQNLRLVHLTSADNTFHWTGSYDWYLNYLVLFPPGCGWNGYTWFEVVAPGQLGHWTFRRGQKYPWDFHRESKADAWRCDANNEPCESEFDRSSALGALHQVVDLLENLPHADPKLVRREDLIEFLSVVIKNAEAYPHDDVFGKEGEVEMVRAFLETLKAGGH